MAIDASAWMYQFLTIVRTGTAAENLQNAEGQATSHLQGFLSRAIKMLESGVRPVFVFDGKPPEMKQGVNRARREVRQAAAQEHAEAVASEDATAEEVYKAASRSTVVTREHNESAKALLQVMGLPVVNAPAEAEAACAQLCLEQLVYASVTEDMDVLTFGSPRQVKNLFDVEGSRVGRGPRPAREFRLAGVLDELKCSMDRFVEFCILCGCDYLPPLPRVGVKTACQLLAREGTLAGVVAAIREGRGPKGCSVPEPWDWQGAKQIFLNGAGEMPDLEALRLDVAPPDYEGLRKFLVAENQFSAARVDTALERLRKAMSLSGGKQQRWTTAAVGSPPSGRPATYKRAARSPLAALRGEGSRPSPTGWQVGRRWTSLGLLTRLAQLRLASGLLPALAPQSPRWRGAGSSLLRASAQSPGPARAAPSRMRRCSLAARCARLRGLAPLVLARASLSG